MLQPIASQYQDKSGHFITINNVSEGLPID